MTPVDGYRKNWIALAMAAVLLVGCSGDPGSSADSKAEEALVHVILQTDWYAQPEHGGFYQAKAKGFYEGEGLSVEIRPGANMNAIPQLVASGRVQFSVGATETLLIHRSRDIPLVSLFPYFQHDPQCVLFHPESGIETLEDLDGREVMFQPGLVYIDFLQKALGLDLKLLPMDWSLARFMTDKEFVQQCFLTSEPIQVRRRGVEPGVIPMSESGFDPYRHVYTSEQEVENRPDMVAAFIRASLKGWRDFMTGDPEPAFELIRASNPQQTVELMTEIRQEMQRYNLARGNRERGEETGQYNKARLRRVIRQLHQIELLEKDVSLEDSFAFDLMPPELVVDRPLADEPIGNRHE